jgi:cyclophilin family peptidyl-prolyl cis-trans isomerase
MNKRFLIILIIAIIVIIAVGYKMSGMTGNAIKENPQVLIKTSMGDIIVELYPDKAPITVKNFLTYVDEKAYDGTVFHRVIADFMVQGGGFDGSGTQKTTHDPIKLESNNGLKNEKYTIAMARTNAPDSATNQFFINTNNNDFLNYGTVDPLGRKMDGYAVFGKVIKGQDVVDKINSVKTTTKNRMDDWPVDDVVIESVKRV